MREVQPEINLLVSPIKEQPDLPRRHPARRSGRCPRGAVMTADQRAVRRLPAASTPSGDAEPGEREGGQAQPRQGRVGPPVVAALHLRARARSWTCPSSRSCRPAGRLGPDLEPPRRDPARSTRRGCGTWSACSCAPPTSQLRPHPWQPKRISFAPRATTSASPPGCSRSGCAAPAATCSACCPSSTTPTPTRSAPTWPASSTPSAPGGPGRGNPARRSAAPPFRPGTCSPASKGTWTSSPTTCGCTTASSARRRSSPR